MDPRLKDPLRRLPVIKTLLAQRDGAVAELTELEGRIAELEAQVAGQGFVPAGHFYSPIPSLVEVARDDERIFAAPTDTIAGIDLRAAEQLQLLRSFIPFYRDMPFAAAAQPGLRYFYDNPAYSYSDAILLHCMIRHLRPKRIVEVGSGFSSCMVLDTNELHFDGSIETTFIEPYPELLLSLLRDGDAEAVRVVPERLQDVDIGVFTQLEAGDILFIDSTHVSKVGSDVNRLIFDVLPILAPGVHVHIHDIFYPFEYTRSWIEEGRAWNEIYLVRAFLLFNSAFEIVLMNTYMEQFHEEFFTEHLPRCLENRGGSIWLRRSENR